MDIAVGYFYLSGFARVADLLATRPGKVRILIGRTDTPTRAEIVAGYGPAESADGFHAAQSRRDESNALGETTSNVGRNAAFQPQDDAGEQGIKSLAQLIADGKIDVRAYVKDRMHAKAYIGYTGLVANPGTAIIGSANFSAAGFTGNTELNYPVTHGGDIAEIREWFERLWNESEPVSDKVVEQLRNSWPLAAPEPYLIYLKALYELYGDTLGEESPFGATEPPVDLTDYQRDAVDAGLAMLNKHGGCYVADVVGLGKTYIGAEILRRLYVAERDAGDPLVICPASLRPMWGTRLQPIRTPRRRRSEPRAPHRSQRRRRPQPPKDAAKRGTDSDRRSARLPQQQPAPPRLARRRERRQAAQGHPAVRNASEPSARRHTAATGTVPQSRRPRTPRSARQSIPILPARRERG